MIAHTNEAFDRQKWIMDGGANAHITNELANMQIQNLFENNTMVIVWNGAGLAIENIDLAFLTFPQSISNNTFFLNNVLHCPQVVKRKLRHILETGLTLLEHSYLSNKYMPDAFLTAIYIIKKLPTPTLD